MKKLNLVTDLKADIRGEVIDFSVDEFAFRIVRTLPKCQRGGYVFPATEKRAIMIEGDNTFYFTDPKVPQKEEVRKVSTGESIKIPAGTAYREFTENGALFVGLVNGDDKWNFYEPYRRIVEESLE